MSRLSTGTRWLSPLAVLLLAAPAAGQNNNDLNAFDFSLPGARSRGMGGAFVAIADDATAVYSNPAGLNMLFKPEVSFEGRNWSFTNTIPDHGHAFGPPTGRGIDTVAGIRNRSWHSSPAGLSFLSFVYPSDRWAAGIFRHQLVRYEMTRRPQGTFFDCSGGFRGDMPPSEPFCEPHAKTDGIDRIFPKDQTIDLNIHSIGSGFAFDWTERLSVGLTVQYFTFEMSAHNQVFSARESKKYEPADYSPANLEIESLQSGTDHAWSANVGFLWDVSERWVVGASFRQGPKFAFRATTVTGPVNLTGSGRIVADEPRNPFRVPDTYAAGVLFRPSAPWRISAEYDLVLFGQLNEDFRDVAQFEGDPEGDLFLRQVRLDDAHQVRVGTEYAVIFRNGTVLAFRGGGWYDPQHQTYFASDPSTGLPAPRWALLFPKGSGTMHWSGGAGIVLGQRLQLDAAADFSDAIDIFSLSAVWRF